MSNDANSDTFDYDFTTPYTNGTSTSGEPKHEMRRNTIRRVSFGDIPDEYLKSLSPQELSPPTTPTNSGGTKIDKDSPYTDVTDDMIERMLSQERDQPSVESLIGGSSQATDLKGLPYLISQFLPLKTYAKQLEKWNKGNSTISALAESYADKRPNVMEQIIEATEHTGLKARELIAKAKQMIAHHESDTTEIVILYFMIYIWATHPKSKKRDIILCVLQDYAFAHDDAEVQNLLHASTQGQCLNLHHATTINADVRSFPGCKRLDPKYSFPTILQNYRALFIICVNTMTWELESKTDMGFLEKSLQSFMINEHNWDDHPLSKTGTSVAEKNAIILTAHRALLTQCHKAGCPDRAPTEHDCMMNLLNCLDKQIFDAVCRIISDEELKPSCYKELRSIVQRAERRVRYQLPLITQCELTRAKIESRHALNSEPAVTKNPSAKDTEEKQITTEEYDATLKTLIDVYTNQPSLEKRTSVAQGPFMFLKHPPGAGVIRTLSKQLQKRHMCTTCGNCDPLFPSHTWRRCPYLNRNPNFILSADDPPPISPLEAVVPSEPKSSQPKNLSALPVAFHDLPAASSETQKLSSFSAAFNDVYPGRTSKVNTGTPTPFYAGTPMDSPHMMYSFSSRIEPLSQTPATMTANPAKSALSPRVHSWSRFAVCFILVVVVNLIYDAFTSSFVPSFSAGDPTSTLPLFGEVKFHQPPLDGEGQYRPMPLSSMTSSSPMQMSGEVPEHVIRNTLTNSGADPYRPVIIYDPEELASNIHDVSASPNLSFDQRIILPSNSNSSLVRGCNRSPAHSSIAECQVRKPICQIGGLTLNHPMLYSRRQNNG